MRLPVGPVQVKEGAGKGRGIRCGEPQIRGGATSARIGSAIASRMSDTSRSLSPVDSSVTSNPNSCARASTTVVDTGLLLFSIWLR